MKRTAIISISLLAAFGSFAQVNLDANAKQLLNAAMISTSPMARSGELRYVDANKFDSAALIMTVADDSVLDDVRALGITVEHPVADMAIVTVTPEQLLELAECPGVVALSSPYDAHIMLDEARATTGVNTIHAGKEADAALPQAYTGKGVIVGMMDTGLDINHVNFLKGVDEKNYFSDNNPGMDIPNRASRVWWISTKGATQTYDTPSKIANFTTDESGDTHATHVLGIAAGSFRGRLAAPIIPAGSNSPNNVRKDNPFYGVAYESDLAVACGLLEGTNIQVALKLINDYAKAEGKPVAMNLSLGHTTGPHDGTTDANRYMNEIGKDMIICVSAGNEGDLPIAIERDLTAGATTIRTCMGETGTVLGNYAIWSSDENPLTVTFAIVDKTNGKTVWNKKLDLKDNVTKITGTYYTGESNRDPVIDQYFSSDSYIVFTPTVSANNNRYNVGIYSQLYSENAANAKRYVPALFVEGKAGARVCMYGNKDGFYSNNISGFISGSADGSINDMACAENVIAVGAYVNKVKWALNGNNKGTIGFDGMTKGELAYFSSYGKTADGRQLPHICGPGMGMISSMSYHYYKKLSTNDYDYMYMVCSLDEGTKRKRASYWVEMSGTSMSAPFVTGVMALWLQADPTLTVDEAKKILAETADKDQFTAINPERWGAGKINALAGLKKVLGASSGVNDVAADGRDILINQIGDETYDLFCAGASEIRAELYNISGMLVASETATGDSLTFTPAAGHGIYVLRVTAGNRTATQKVTIR